MEKFNAIKILEEEQEEKDLFYRNLGKEHHMKLAHKFVDKYVLPKMKQLNNEGKITYNLNTDDEDIFCKSKLLETRLYILVNDLALTNDDIDFLNTDDKEIINAVVEDISDYVVNTYEEHTK